MAIEFLSFKTPRDSENTERVVWHPDVHHRIFRETCHYFLIRIKKPEGEFGREVLRVIEAAQIHAACVYEIYGYFDVMVRLWATPIKLAWFYDLAYRADSPIENMDEFRVSTVDFVSAKTQTYSSRQILQFEDDVRALSADDSENGRVPLSSPLVQKYIANGVIWRFARLDHYPFKFYVALKRITPTLNIDQARQNIHSLLESVISPAPNLSLAPIPLENVAIYEGIGFADFLVKVVVTDYRDVIKCVKRIIGSSTLKDLRPTTYLIADAVQESDVIDYSWNEFATSLFQLVSLLGPTCAERVRELSQDEQIVFGNLYTDFHYLEATDFRNTFLGVFEARLLESPLLLAEKLLVVFQLESLLREFLIQLAKLQYGARWHDKMQEALPDFVREQLTRSKDPGKPYDVTKLTLHSTTLVFGKLSSKDAEFKAKAIDVLGEDWDQELNALQDNDVRNNLAHGRILTDESFVRNRIEWETIARTVLGVGRMYNSLVQWRLNRDTV